MEQEDNNHIHSDRAHEKRSSTTQRMTRLADAEILRLLDDLREGIQIINRDWKIVYANHAAAGQARKTKEELLGRSIVSAYPGIENTETFQLFRKCMDSGESARLDEEFTFPDAADCLLELHIESADVGIVVLSIDITKRKNEEMEKQKLNEQLAQAQKMECVGRLAGGIAHDFNNLMTVVIGYSDLLLKHLGNADENANKLLREIRTAGDRAAGLTRQLLVFTRKQLIQPKALNLNKIIESMEKMLRRLIEEDISLAVATEADLGKVLADPGQIEQIIMNLAVNARDAMPGGGKLTIATRNLIVEKSCVLTHGELGPGRYVTLSIADTGTGMSPEIKSRLFEPFFTTKEHGKGTGLGLCTIYGIVKQISGSLNVHSELGKGTCFEIHFPLAGKEPNPTTKGRLIIAPGQSAKTILVVEDEDCVRNLICDILMKAGYDVLYARNGQEAIQKIENGDRDIHLVLTDVVMPGMSGRDMIEMISKEKKPSKILFMSGYTDDSVLEHGVLYSEVEFLQKPFTPEELLLKLVEVFGK